MSIGKGLGIGLWIATGLSAWVALLALRAGSAPFSANGTTLLRVVIGYYEGGLFGGFLVGIAWPLRRWVAGYAVLGILGVFPLYLFQRAGQLLSLHSLATALLGAFFVGSGVGVWAWSDDHPHGPHWFDTFRFPTAKTALRTWAAAIGVATLAFILVPQWSVSWPFELILLAAGLLFVVPIVTALLVTMRFKQNRGNT